MGANCKLQRRAYWAKTLFGLIIYLCGGSGYPTLGCSRLRDPMEALPSLSLCFLLLHILSFSLLPFPKLASPSLPSFLIFIALVNGVIIIIFPFSAKKGLVSINLSGFLGTNGFGNGFHCSECVRQRSFLCFAEHLNGDVIGHVYRARKWFPGQHASGASVVRFLSIWTTPDLD